jgi:sec-independent protein translocase protein TatC
MPRKSDKDLFRESTMTFGEHLEELRMALFWALLWLVGGFIVGLFIAKPVVHFIQGPLQRALAAHHKAAATLHVKAKLSELEDQGLLSPGTAEQMGEQLADLVANENLLPEEAYIQPSDLLRQLRTIYTKVRQDRTEAAQLLQDAVGLLERARLPTGNPKKELSDEELEHVGKAVRLLEPGDFPATGAQAKVTQEELDDLVETVEDGDPLDKAESARVIAALEGKRKRFREELARVAEGIDLLGQTILPVPGPQEQLQRDDLVRIYIWRPIEADNRIQTQALNPSEAFMIYIKAALLVGVLIASPGIFWHIWSFVAAGLYHHERRFVYVFGPFSLALFFAGSALVFIFVFQIVLRFLFWFNERLGIGIEPRITEWLGFVLILPLGFGIAFQLPLVMLFLERIGVFDTKAYLAKWRIAVLVIFVLSMLLTPADPGSMLLMAIPMTALYFGGILLCRYMPRSRSPYEEPED